MVLMERNLDRHYELRTHSIPELALIKTLTSKRKPMACRSEHQQNSPQKLSSSIHLHIHADPRERLHGSIFQAKNHGTT
jgi:hypothetical protein